MTQTPRIGDDVVDLGDPVTATAHLRPRYVARVCSPAERARVDVAADPPGMLWSLFAAKEAAFKAVSKLRPGTIFAHREFEVAADLETVRYRDLVLHLRVHRDGDCIHAVAVLGDPATIARSVNAVDRVDAGADTSVAARSLLRARLSEQLDCDEDELSVFRAPLPGSWNGYGPPQLRRGGAPVDRDISLSHDGRFVSFAAVDRIQP